MGNCTCNNPKMQPTNQEVKIDISFINKNETVNNLFLN
jgi:hypothetical protein